MFRLGAVANLRAGALSYGQQKLVDIAMAFMPRPRLVLLDEPCAGVNPTLIDELFRLLQRLNAEHAGTFVVIEHNMDFVMRLCSRVICMAQGRVLAEGAPAAEQADATVPGICGCLSLAHLRQGGSQLRQPAPSSTNCRFRARDRRR